MSMTGGTYTVGLGKNYSTLTGALNDVAWIPGLESNLILVVYGTVTETASPTDPIKFNGCLVEIYGATPHNGDPTTGSKIVLSVDYSIYNHSGTPGAFSIHDLIIQATDVGGHNFIFQASTSSLNVDLTMKDMIFLNTTLIQPAVVGGLATGLHQYNNLKFSGRGINMASVNNSAATFFNNITIDGEDSLDYGFIIADSLGMTLRNVAVCRTTTADFSAAGTISAKAYNCASEDTTATDISWSASSGNADSIAPASQFKSLDNTEADYLFLLDEHAGSLSTGGTAPQDVYQGGQVVFLTDDIAGLSVPDSESYYPIGCHVSVSADTAHQVMSLF